MQAGSGGSEQQQYSGDDGEGKDRNSRKEEFIGMPTQRGTQALEKAGLEAHSLIKLQPGLRRSR